MSTTIVTQQEMHFFDLTIPQGTAIPRASVEMPKKKGSVVLANIGSILNWFLTGHLHPYNFNRGQGQVSQTTSKNVEGGIHPDIIGECTYGWYESPNSDQKGWCLNNWHGRLHGCLRRYLSDNLSKTELAISVSVRVQERFISSYQLMNLNTGHRTKDKIVCPDLVYGAIIQDVYARLSEGCQKLIGSNRWTVLSSILFNMDGSPKKKREWYWPAVYQKRSKAMERANEAAGTIVISSEMVQKLVQAIHFWYDLVMQIEAAAGPSNVNVSKIRTSAGFFGYIICDRMEDTPGISDNKKALTKRIFRHLSDIMELCPELCRGDTITVKKFTGHLNKILGRKEQEVEEQEEVEVA